MLVNDPLVELSMSVGAPLSEVCGEEEVPVSQAELSVSGFVSLVAVVSFGCSVQVCWSLIWLFSGGVSRGFYFVSGSREALTD